MKNINLVYWDSDNFGDVLNPVLVEELSGLKVQHKDILGGPLNIIRKIIKGLVFCNVKYWRQIYIPGQQNIVGMGSIISWANEHSTIWGSGFMNESEHFRGGEVKAVRGPNTAVKLQNSGFPRCEVFGDPALLLPLCIQPSKSKKYKLSLIPHWKEVDRFKERFGEEYHIIDLRTRDVFKVISEITASEYILSSSLHGVIVPHAYQIPALWIEDGYIDTDGFKFQDYFSSVEIPNYKGFKNIKEILKTEEAWMDLFIKNKDRSMINLNLKNIQSDLLKAAPFPIRDFYKKYY